MAYETQKYDKTRNANAAGQGGLTGALSGFGTGAAIGAAAGGIPGAIIGGLIGAATVGAGSAGANAWTDDAAQKQEIKASEEAAKSAALAEKEGAMDAEAMKRANQRPGQYAAPSLPSASTYLPSSGGVTGYDTWKAQLRSS